MATPKNDYTLSETQLEQALALNDRLLKSLESTDEHMKKVRRWAIICAAVYLLCTLSLGVILGVLASGITIETTTTEETAQTQTIEGDSIRFVFTSGINDGAYIQSGVNGQTLFRVDLDFNELEEIDPRIIDLINNKK